MTVSVHIAVALTILLGLTATVHAVDNQTISVSIRYSAAFGNFSAADNESFGPVAATVTTNFSYYQSGWDVVTATGDATFMSGSETQRLLGYRAAGFGEGYLNYIRIFQNYNNTFFGPYGVETALQTPEVAPWIQRHISYLRNRSLLGDDVAKSLGGLMAIIDGMADGYNAANQDPAKSLNATDLFILNFQNEVYDIIDAYSTAEDRSIWAALPQLDPRPPQHCSALVKILPNDVYFSHVTWSGFNSMMRQYKTYSFENRTVVMSGYPGVIHSIDDWYMTSNQLAVMETTNGVYNKSLFEEFVKPGTSTISEFLRVMIANFLAHDAPSWVDYFKTENSGTYNNQWMIFDMKKFTPGQPLPANTFWVAEQLPGSSYPYGVTAADLTETLDTTSFWSSYNLPYFPNVYNVSENLKKYLDDGNFFSYTNYSRAEIFRRNQSFVVDMESMKAMMRYNDYLHDPLSRIANCSAATGGVCSPSNSSMLSIASRGDLQPQGEASSYGVDWKFLTQRNHAATDVKIAYWSAMQTNVFDGVVINGPTTYNGLKPFQWSTSPFVANTSIIREGLPDLFDFPFVTYASNVMLNTSSSANPTDTPAPAGGEGSKTRDIAIGLGVAGGVIVIAVIVGLIIKSRAAAKENEEQMGLVDRP